MNSTQQNPEQDDRQARQERAQRAAGTQPHLEVPGDPEQLAERIATAGRVDGAQA